MPEILRLKSLKRSRIELVTVEDIRNAAVEKFVLIDVGTGDGKYPYRAAMENKEAFCIGLDPAEKNMIEISGKIGAKASRGGVENLLLLSCALEDVPDELEGIADRVTVNFPWGVLQKIVVTPEREGLEKLRMLIKKEGTLEVFLNMHVFEEEHVVQKAGLPDVDVSYIEKQLTVEYQKCGLRINEIQEVGPGEISRYSKWGGRLSKGSGRNSVVIKATAMEKSNDK